MAGRGSYFGGGTLIYASYLATSAWAEHTKNKTAAIEPKKMKSGEPVKLGKAKAKKTRKKRTASPEEIAYEARRKKLRQEVSKRGRREFTVEFKAPIK